MCIKEQKRLSAKAMDEDRRKIVMEIVGNWNKTNEVQNYQLSLLYFTDEI